MTGAFLALAVVSLLPLTARATMVLQMNIEDLTERAGLIFRGTVLDVVPGTVSVGGGELPTTTYNFQVGEILKGDDSDYMWKGGEAYIAVTMVGSIKGSQNDGELSHISPLPAVPVLDTSRDYLMFTTTPSSVGLSTTVGLAQGLFEIQVIDKQENAVNGNNNLGLFDGTAVKSIRSGPLPYEALVDEVSRLVRHASVDRGPRHRGETGGAR